MTAMKIDIAINVVALVDEASVMVFTSSSRYRSTSNSKVDSC
jgi:hypothetical protein